MSEAHERVNAALTERGISDALTPLGKGVFRAGDMVLKTWGPDQSDKAQAQVKRQVEVAEAMTGTSRAPAVHFFDQSRLVMAMPSLKGENLASLWQNGNDQVPQFAGLWLRNFHALTAREAQFWPKGQVTWLRGLIQAAQSGAREIVEPHGFCIAAQRVIDSAKSARGKPCRKAVTHRDMTLSNLISTEGAVWGIDFENSKEDEPLRDVFTLALDLAVLVPERPDDALERLRRAYDDQHTAPEVRVFLQRCFCLWVWANTPARPSKRQLARLEWAERWLKLDAPVI